MSVFIYNLETPRKKFIVSEPGNRTFTDKLLKEGDPRYMWDQMMLYLQKEKILNKTKLYPDTLLVKVASIEALQCKNTEAFKRLISEFIKFGGQLYTIEEQALFNKEYPNGISSQPEKLEKAMEKLQGKVSSGASVSTDYKKNKPQRSVIEI